MTEIRLTRHTNQITVVLKHIFFMEIICTASLKKRMRQMIEVGAQNAERGRCVPYTDVAIVPTVFFDAQSDPI